jgi:4a-hydroxytetrahydrobiopterin dehydratase
MTSKDDLTSRQCEPCEGGVPPLEAETARDLLQALNDGWSISDDGKWIRREFEFSGFNRTMGFVNAVAWIANTEGHHPDLEVGYYKCVVNYTTHAINGLSENDFICAAKIDRLFT